MDVHPSWTKQQLVAWLLFGLFCLTVSLLAAVLFGALAYENEQHSLIAVPCACLALVALWRTPQMLGLIWDVLKALVRRKET